MAGAEMRAPVANQQHKTTRLLIELREVVEQRLGLNLTVEAQVFLESRFLDALQDPQLSIVDLARKKRRH